jgi:hypothetical protein
MTYRRILQEIVISVDGKTLRGTIPYGESRGVHLFAVYVPGQRLVLARAEVDKKENEIMGIPILVSQLVLAGKIVLADAMHTQKALSTQIVEAKADYVWVA